MDVKVTLKTTGRRSNKGEIYEVEFNGEVIAAGISPEFAACRELKARGLTGTAYFHRPGKLTHDMRMGIEWGAGRTVSETDRGLRFAKWVPNPMFAKADDLEEAA